MKHKIFYTIETRKITVKNYEITPIQHTSVLNCENIISECTGKKLVEHARYYRLKLTNKNSKEEKYYCLAKSTAENLLSLASQKPLEYSDPLFDDIKNKKDDNNIKKSTILENKNNIQSLDKIPDLNKEAFNAIRIVMLSLNVEPNALNKSWKEIYDNAHLPTELKPSTIKGFNTSLKIKGNMKHHISIVEQKYRKCLHSDFPLMRIILLEYYGLEEKDINL